jgi:hypothetical protein
VQLKKGAGTEATVTVGSGKQVKYSIVTAMALVFLIG